MEELQDSVLVKLEKVVSKHTSILEKKISIVEELSKRNDRTLRGNNGNLGLNAKVSRLEELLPEIRDSITALENKLLTGAEMEKMVETLCSRKVDKRVEEEQERVTKAIIEKANERDVITFKWVFVEVVKPLLIAGFLYLLLEFFPAIGLHLGGG